MERLIILSDLWGKKTEWLNNYVTILKDHFKIECYDSCELGKIDLTAYSEKKIHHQFVNGGIEKAVMTLLHREKKMINILGFSIGGYIAWKACGEGLKVNNLIAVSSTRLRHENIKPACAIHLMYGENDRYKPENDWFIQLNLDKKIYLKEEHDFYTKKEIATAISHEIIKKLNPK